MAQATKTRVMEITTPLGADVLLFHRMNALDELSRLSEYQIGLLSARSDINLDEIMGKNVTVKLELPKGGPRFFNGFVTRFAQMGTYERYYMYHATVRPWLWFLTRRSNCRIFQDMTVRQIIEKIFNDHKVADFKFDLSGNYAKWDYCVQYRESDFNFVSRLMEQEGMYYFLRHQDKRHTVVITDSYSSHSTVGGYEEIPFIPTGRSTVPKQEHITSWNFEREIKPGRFVIDDYNFETPSVELQTKTQVTRKHELADYEVYDYPGEYDVRGDGEQYVRTRLEEIQANFELIQAHGNARGVTVGSLFKLSGHTRTDQNREYLITSASYNLEYSDYEGMGGGGGGSTYGCSFVAMNSGQPFRAVRSTTKPFVRGPQTAVVVGPSGDEIYTDKYGRVKVQFHWDREGKQDENASCWMRVSHPWAGKGWGAVSIPRIGQEVIVDFLEGDPDQPIITGRVYNAEQMPPWQLPANATQSGILSRSSKGAGAANANAIRMEDKKGAEQMWIHAEKNQDIEVENDETHWVGHDRRKTVDHDETVHVKHDRMEKVDHDEAIEILNDRKMTIHHNKTEEVLNNKRVRVAVDHSESVDGAMSITVGSTLTEVVGINYAETVGGAMELTVGAAMSIGVGGALVEAVGVNRTETIGGGKSVTVGSQMTVEVGKNLTESIGETRTVDIKKDLKETIEGEHLETVTKQYMLKAKKILFNAEDEISFKTGSAEIVLKKNGDIMLKGAKIQIKGSGDVIIKGSNIKQN